MEDDRLNFAGGPGEEPAPPAPAKPGGRKWRRAAVVLAVIAALGAAAAAAVPAVFRAVNPKAYVAVSLARTLGDFSADSAAILSDVTKAPFRVHASLESGLAPADPSDDENALEAVAPRMVYTALLEYDAPNRRADLSLDLSLSGRHTASVLFQADDAVVSFGSPELTGGAFYCVNTETLGADMAASPVFGQSGILDPACGFNLFAPAAGGSALAPATAALLKQFTEALNKAVTVEKAGSAAVFVLGRETVCTEYVMTVPRDALRGCVGQSLRALSEDEAFSKLPVDCKELIDAADRLLSKIQDAVTLHFYISKDRVALLDVEIPTDADDVWPTGQWTMEFGAGGSAMRQRFTITEDGETLLNASFVYQDGGQFTLSLNLPDGDGFYAGGLLAANRAAKTVSLDLPELSVTSRSATTTLGAHFSIEPTDGFTNALPAEPTPFWALDRSDIFGLMLQAVLSVGGSVGGGLS